MNQANRQSALKGCKVSNEAFFYTPNYSEDWKVDLKNAIKSYQGLHNEIQDHFSTSSFPIFIPRPLLQKIIRAGKSSPLYKQFIPQDQSTTPEGLKDPIGDQGNLKTSNLIHRYNNRVLILPTSNCPVHCRYCFRQNLLEDEYKLNSSNIEQSLKYLKEHQEINEVILTGGDPLFLDNKKIEILFNQLREISSIEFLRIHTRFPVILPNRFDQELIQILKKANDDFSDFKLVIHTNHLMEFDEQVLKTIQNLNNEHIDLLSQTVLLKGVNDNSQSLQELFYLLIKYKVRPYYLHHPDKVEGGMNFYLSKEEGIKIYNKLRHNLPGWAIPHYIIDSPDGSGKKLVANVTNC